MKLAAKLIEIDYQTLHLLPRWVTSAAGQGTDSVAFTSGRGTGNTRCGVARSGRHITGDVRAGPDGGRCLGRVPQTGKWI